METYESRNVKEIQTYLRQLAYFDRRIPLIPIDGVFDTETRDAVIIFQQINSLEPTGTVDMQTFDLLYSQYLQSIEHNSYPAQPTLFPYINGEFDVGIGDGGFICHAVNHMLFELSVSYNGIEISDETLKSGLFTEETQKAIVSFQTTVGLEPSGKVDHATWNELATQYNSKAHTGE